ncbi:MAG TPA: hypothetical protein VJN89_02250 [Candidatus Acidoferrum sp.]|nr:hypothetical protein [Candidatus Acidoferrum sp.]
MQRSRLTKVAVRVTVVLAALVLGFAALSVFERWRTQAEFGTVLSAFFSDTLLHDIQKSGSGRAVQVIILREGPRDAIWKARWLNLLLDRKMPFPQASPVTLSSLFLSNAVTTDTAAELRLPKGVDFVVVSRSELERGQLGIFAGRSLDNVEYFAVSQPGLNFSKTEAILYIDYGCLRVTDLCGGGGYILMRKVNGVWSVVDRHMTWES